MQNIRLWLILFFFIPHVLTTESVVAKQRKQRPSEIKQEIVQTLGSMMKTSAQRVEAEAQLQQQLIDIIYDLSDPDDTSFFTQASVEELKKSKVKLDQLNDTLENITKEQKKSVSIIRNELFKK